MKTQYWNGQVTMEADTRGDAMALARLEGMAKADGYTLVLTESDDGSDEVKLVIPLRQRLPSERRKRGDGGAAQEPELLPQANGSEEHVT